MNVRRLASVLLALLVSATGSPATPWSVLLDGGADEEATALVARPDGSHVAGGVRLFAGGRAEPWSVTLDADGNAGFGGALEFLGMDGPQAAGSPVRLVTLPDGGALAGTSTEATGLVCAVPSSGPLFRPDTHALDAAALTSTVLTSVDTLRLAADGTVLVAGQHAREITIAGGMPPYGAIGRFDATTWTYVATRGFGADADSAARDLRAAANGDLLAAGITRGGGRALVTRASGAFSEIWSRTLAFASPCGATAFEATAVAELSGGDLLVAGLAEGCDARGWLVRLDSRGALRWGRRADADAGAMLAVIPIEGDAAVVVAEHVALRVEADGSESSTLAIDGATVVEAGRDGDDLLLAGHVGADGARDAWLARRSLALTSDATACPAWLARGAALVDEAAVVEVVSGMLIAPTSYDSPMTFRSRPAGLDEQACGLRLHGEVGALVVLRDAELLVLAWEPHSDDTSWSCFVADLAAARVSGEAPVFAPLACGLPQPEALVVPGLVPRVAAFLASCQDASGTGALGSDSSGVPRIVSPPCP